MQNYEIELVVIGALINHNERIQDIDLLPDEFAFEVPRLMYTAILDLVSQGTAFDIFTLADYLGRHYRHIGDDWSTQLANIQINTNSRNIKHYANAVRDAHTKRMAASAAQELIDSIETTGQHAVDDAIKKLMEIGRTKKKFEYSIKEVVAGAVDELDTAFNAKGMLGVPTGIRDIDEILGGVHNTDLVVVGARPAMGKTAFLLNCVLNSGVPSGLMSSEQGHAQIGTRMLSIDGMVNAQLIRKPKQMDDSDFSKITLSSARLMDRSIWVNDMPGPTLQDIQRQARKWRFQNGMRCLYIDYLQRIKGDQKLPRHEQVGNIAMGLKELARELEVPIIVLAQVNREVEKRTDKRPMMSDLKDSGSIEQEADVILTLYRDEVYNINSPDVGIMEVGVQKNRHGVTGRIKTRWAGEYLKIMDLARDHENSEAA